MRKFLRNLEKNHPRMYDLLMVIFMTIVSIGVMFAIYAILQNIPVR
jgi:hypothetical protein